MTLVTQPRPALQACPGNQPVGAGEEVIQLALPGTPQAPARRQVLEVADLAPWLADPVTRGRYLAKVFTAGGLGACWPFLGAISDTGHGKFQVGSRTDGTALIVSAHRVAYQLVHGPLLPGQQVRHQCDESSCQNPDHLVVGDAADNAADWARRRWTAHGPLQDHRGAAGRAVAIREAIKAAADSGAGLVAQWAAAMAAARQGLTGPAGYRSTGPGGTGDGAPRTRLTRVADGQLDLFTER